MKLAARSLTEAICRGAAGDRSVGQLGALVTALLPLVPARGAVVLACEDRFAFTAALLAAWARGAVVHLPVNLRAQTVAEVAAGGALILHDQPGAAGLDVGSVAVGSPVPLAGFALGRDEVAAVVYTSGSTGRPVAHGKTLGQLLGEAETLAHAFGLEGRTVLASVPSHHIYGLLFGVLVPLVAAGAMSRATPLFPAEVVAVARAIGAEVWVTVPPHLVAFAATDVTELRDFQRVFSSGGPVPGPTLAALVAAGAPLVQVFGSTETGGIAARTGDESAWRPLPGVAVSTDGEQLVVSSPWLSPGERRFVTQDRVQLLPDGRFSHLGRADGVVKVGGRRVALGDLEAHLGEVPGVRRARVLAVDSAGSHGVELWAAVESDDATLTPALIRAALAGSLDAVSLPRRIRIVPALPVGPAGKIARADLLALFAPPPSPDRFAIEVRALDDTRFVFTPAASLGFFEGHFRGQPILPAVVQLERLALRLARRCWSDLGMLKGLGRVKFKRPIQPGDEVVVALARPKPGTVSFELQVGGQAVSGGNMHFAGGASTEAAS